jgi:hypothetical protein
MERGLLTHVEATSMEESDIQDDQRQLSNLSVRKTRGGELMIVVRYLPSNPKSRTQDPADNEHRDAS